MASTLTRMKRNNATAWNGQSSTTGSPRPSTADTGVSFQVSTVIALLLAVAAGAGLFVHGVYRNNAFATAAFRGSDLVSLVVAVPTLLVSAVLARKGSRRAHLVWLGTLGYVAYTYIYTFGIAFNRLFLVYLALLSLSVFAIVRSVVALDAQDIARRFGERTPVRGSPCSCGSSGECSG